MNIQVEKSNIDIDLNLTPCTDEFELDCRPKFQHQSIKFL